MFTPLTDLILAAQTAAPAEAIPTVVWLFFGVFFILFLTALLCHVLLVRNWLYLRVNDIPATFLEVALLPLRGVRTSLLVKAAILLKASGIDVTLETLAEFYLANRTRLRSTSQLVELYSKHHGDAST